MNPRKNCKFIFKKPSSSVSNGGSLERDNGVPVKKEYETPNWGGLPPTKEVKTNKRKVVTIGGRRARIDELQKRHGIGLIE